MGDVFPADRLALSRRELARACGVSPRIIQHWELDGLPHVRMADGGATLYRPEAVRQWLAERETVVSRTTTTALQIIKVPRDRHRVRTNPQNAIVLPRRHEIRQRLVSKKRMETAMNQKLLFGHLVLAAIAMVCVVAIVFGRGFKAGLTSGHLTVEIDPHRCAEQP